MEVAPETLFLFGLFDLGGVADSLAPFGLPFAPALELCLRVVLGVLLVL
jgi:hypothetical protein